MNVPYLFRIKYGIDQWYKMNEKREITKTKSIIENPDREKLKASVSIIKALSGHFVSIKNDSRFRWNNVLVGIQYMGENYVVSVKEISQGKPVDINLSTFSSGTNYLPAKYMPEKIELSADEGIYVWGTDTYEDKALPGE